VEQGNESGERKRELRGRSWGARAEIVSCWIGVVQEATLRQKGRKVKQERGGVERKGLRERIETPKEGGTPCTRKGL